MSQKEKMNKNVIPEGFTIKLAMVDAVPVLFFGLTALMLGLLLNSTLLNIGAWLTMISGALKVLWKFIVVRKKKNVWALFLQMRIAMPIGFVLMIAGVVTSNKSFLTMLGKALITPPSLIFLIIGIIGMTMMFVFAAKLDSSDAKSNWIEQLTNGIAQMAFFLALLFIVLGFGGSTKKTEVDTKEPDIQIEAEAAQPTPLVVEEEKNQMVYEGFQVSGTELLDACGNPFVMRGINMAHKWYALQDAASFKAIAETGANCVRIVCADGDRWTADTAKGLSTLIDTCKKYEMIAILEVHDATGKNDLESLAHAVDYWISNKDVFAGTEAYCIINIANEWLAGWNDKTWREGYVDAVTRLREAGIKNTLMVDTGGYGQYGKCIEKQGKEVFAADTLGNTMFSIHMYGTAGKNEKTIKTNLEGATNNNLCVVVGEFGHTHSDGDVDEDFLMEYCVENSIGYLGWSWKGNSGGVEYLDIALKWDGSELSSDWGEKIVNGKNGIKQTSKKCTVFEIETE